MIKFISILLFMYSPLFATDTQELGSDVMNGIYIEAALFVGVVLLMSIGSIIISKKHAAQNILNDQKEKAEQDAPEEMDDIPEKEIKYTGRMAELSRMLDDGLITDEEFQVLTSTVENKPR